MNIRFTMILVLLLLTGTASIAQEHDSIISTGKTYLGIASYYGKGFHGKLTASGEIFNQYRFTAASNVIPLGTWVRVTNLKNQRQVVVKINDRLHYRMRRIADLSQAAAEKLGFIRSGLAKVKIEVIHKTS